MRKIPNAVIFGASILIMSVLLCGGLWLADRVGRPDIPTTQLPE